MEFIVAYNADLQPNMDLQLMHVSKQSLAISQLSHGKTLEENFFSGE